MAGKEVMPDEHDRIKQFYDTVYYKYVPDRVRVTGHLRALAKRLGISRNERVLDVGCGVGQFLLAAKERGALPAGVDLSGRAIRICRDAMPEGEFRVGPAEHLPFTDGSFDVVTCLGSLEHFVDKVQALREIVRVAREDARVVILVPNSGFLTRRLGLYRGTQQARVREDVLSLTAWERLFNTAGLGVQERWRDLHVLSWTWIGASRWYRTPVRLVQAIMLPLWPLSWQYQVYHLCKKTQSGNDT